MDLKKIGALGLSFMTLFGASVSPVFAVDKGSPSAKEAFEISFDNIDNTLEEAILPSRDLIGINMVNEMLKTYPKVQCKGNIGNEKIDLLFSHPGGAQSMISAVGSVGKSKVNETLLPMSNFVKEDQEAVINGKKVNASIETNKTHEFSPTKPNGSILDSLTLKKYSWKNNAALIEKEHVALIEKEHVALIEKEHVALIEKEHVAAIIKENGKLNTLNTGSYMQSVSQRYSGYPYPKLVKLTTTRNNEPPKTDWDKSMQDEALSVKMGNITKLQGYFDTHQPGNMETSHITAHQQDINQKMAIHAQVKGEYVSVVLTDKGSDFIIHPVIKSYQLEGNKLHLISKVGDVPIDYYLMPAQ